MDTPPRILFAISDTGGGHRSAAVALDAALEQLAGSGAEPGTERQIVDLLARSGFPLVQDAPDLWDNVSRWLPLYDLLFRLTDGRRRIDLLTRLVYLRARRNVLRVLEEASPDLVVSTHPLANRLISNARRTARLGFRFVIVVTELVTLHAAWGDPSAELCLVPTDEGYDRLRRRGMPEQKLVRTGFPIHPKFAAYRTTQREARARLGIDRDPFTVLITGGGVGAGMLRELVPALDRAYPQQQFLVVTGKNVALREDLLALGLRPGVRVFGFVDNMEELMAASDIIVTKAGPGTLMEALAMRRPVIVTEAVGIQERGNIDYVVDRKLGVFCPTIDRIVAAVAELMSPAAYAATSRRLDNAVPRDGATQIARMLLEQLHLAQPAF